MILFLLVLNLIFCVLRYVMIVVMLLGCMVCIFFLICCIVEKDRFDCEVSFFVEMFSMVLVV